jgi:hydroxypyruvate reductase
MPRAGDVWLIAAGKASAAMAAFAVERLGERLKGGVVVAPSTPDLKIGSGGDHSPFDLQGSPVRPTFESVAESLLDVFVGGHPLPTDASVAAGRRALEMAAAAHDHDRLLVLLSGGASALLACPAAGVTLADKRETGSRLLAAGADIHALNTVRKHLSAIKGGQLAASTPASTVTLAISDVVGDDPSVIGSGPTAPDDSTCADALAVLDRFGGRSAYPVAVVARLERCGAGGLPETPKTGDSRLGRARYRIIGGRRDAMAGAAAEARRLGYTVVVQDEPVVGDARDAGRRAASGLVGLLTTAARPLCLVSSGETTVRVSGSGRGGRNQEFALAAAQVLAERDLPLMCASVGTDGIDGPTDAAGAMVDPSTWSRAVRAGADPVAALANNDVYAVFHTLGDLVSTGPTGTNVGDLQVWLAR